jgi:hypothetical protein
MYLSIPDYRSMRSRMDEDLRRANQARLIDQLRRARRPRSIRSATVLDHGGRRVARRAAIQLRVVE